jgi:hypothetical protein
MPRGSIRGTATLIALMVMAAYVFAVIVHVVPEGPAARAIRPTTDRLLQPVFFQRWTLFAPTPPLADFQTLVYTRNSRTGSEEGPFDMSEQLFETAKRHRFAPPRLMRVDRHLQLLAQFAQARRQLEAVDKALATESLPEDTRRSLTEQRNELNRELKRSKEAETVVQTTLQRYLARTAPHLPGGRAADQARLVMVRVETESMDPSAAPPGPLAPIRATIYDSSWLGL